MFRRFLFKLYFSLIFFLLVDKFEEPLVDLIPIGDDFIVLIKLLRALFDLGSQGF